MQSKMKILQIIPYFETGGAQRLLSDMLGVLSRRDDVELTVAVYSSLPDSPFEEHVRGNNRVNFVDIHSSAGSHLKTILKLRRLIAGADVCHVHLFPALYDAAIASMGLKTKMVYTEHSTYNRRRNNRLLRLPERFVYSRYDSIAGISEASLSNLRNWLGAERGDARFHTVANGIDLERFANNSVARTEAELQERRKQLFGREGKPVLMISRFVDSKDHPTLIRAIAAVDNPDYFVAFIGTGKRREEFETLALRIGVKNRVVFLGERANIEDYIEYSEIGVQSSNWEGFGLTVTEMMAGGLPVIVSDVSGMKSLVDGVGITFLRGDSDALAKSIISLGNRLEIPGEREKISEIGRKRAACYDISHTAEGYMKIFREEC